MNKKLISCLLVVVFLFAPSKVVFSEGQGDAKVQKDRQLAMLDVLDLKAMDIMDVLKLISQKSGVNIVANQNVKGKVTVYLRDVTVLQALEIIVDAYGWAFAKDGGVIKIMTAKEYEQKYGTEFGKETKTTIKQLLFIDPKDITAILNEVKSPSGKVIAESKSSTLILMDTEDKIADMTRIIERLDVPIKTEVFELSYATAEELSQKVSEMLTPDIGKMKFDSRSNRIIVSDASNKLKDIKKMINAFDQKDKQVLIEAKIIQVVLSDHQKMGIDWSAIVSDFHNLTMNSNYSNLGDTEKRGDLSIGTISSDDYEVLIEALQTVGVTDILSSPRITTVNNKEAKILVGSTEPYVTSTTTTPSSGPTTTAESVNFIEVGVKLFVTPTIHTDDFITMKIKPEVSSVVTTVSTGNNNTIPVVETSEAETTVVVKNGVTIVIGGLIKETKIKETKKVPLLGDIPFVKRVFMSEDEQVSKTELVIFLTPTIISGDVPAEGSLFSQGLLYLDEY